MDQIRMAAAMPLFSRMTTSLSKRSGPRVRAFSTLPSRYKQQQLHIRLN
jgi:hypothetical protein